MMQDLWTTLYTHTHEVVMLSDSSFLAFI
jgi:hypothetical protein